jgi:hypothetical protein
MDPFEEFLGRKKIDAAGFRAAFPTKYETYRAAFQAAGSTATDYARKFQWNDLRLEFPIKAENPKKD